MKKIGKIFVPILSGLATIGVVAPLITACSKNAKKYEVNIVNATGVTGEVIQNEFGKNITIKYRLERGYDINKDQVKYIVGTGAAKDPIINETSKEIIINYDSKWPENAAIKLVLASINLEYKITIDHDDHITSEIKEQHMGKPIEIEFHSDFAYTIDQSASWVKYGDDPVTTGLEWSANKLTIREQLSWTDKTQIRVHFETNHEQIPEDNFAVTPDEGFDGYGITTRYLDEDIIISYTLKQYFDFKVEDTTVEIDEQPYTKWEKQGDSGIRIEKPVTGWTTSTNVEVNFASKRQEFNVIINESHVGFTDPEVMNHKVGENITIQCGLDDDSYIWNKAIVDPALDPESISYDPETDILTIIPDSSWTKRTEIKVQLVADELFTGLTVDPAEDDEGFGKPEIIQQIVGKPIVIKCNTISSKCYRFDENNIDIVAPSGPESVTYDSTEDTLTIIPGEGWGQTSTITVTLHSYQEFKKVDVTAGDEGFDEPTVEKKTVGDEIVIKCNTKTTEGYLFDEEKLQVSPTPAVDPTYDSATDTLTIVPNEWAWDEEISVKLYSYQEFSDIDVAKDEGFGEPVVTERLFGQPIVIKCNIKTTEGYLFDEEKLEVSPTPAVDPTYDPTEDTLTIVPNGEWTWDEEISVTLHSYQEFEYVTVTKDEGFGELDIPDWRVGQPIVITCNTKTTEGYLFDEEGLEVSPTPKSATYDSDNDTLTIVPNDNWTRTTPISVKLYSYQEFINLTVDPAEEDIGFGEPEIMEGKVGQPIVIKCNTKTTEGYLFDEEKLEVSPTPAVDPTYDPTEDTLTIVPDDSWEWDDEISVTLHSYQGFKNVTVTGDEGFGNPTVAKAVVGDQIVINCNSHDDVDFDDAVITAEPAYEGEPVYDKDTDTLTFDAMEGWNLETVITVALSSKVGIAVNAGATTLDGGFGSDGNSSTPITAALTTGSKADVTTNTTFALVDEEGQPYSKQGISIGEITGKPGEKYIKWDSTAEAGQYEFYVKGTYNLDSRAVEKSNKVTLTIHKMKIGYSSETEPYEIVATAGVEGSDTQTVNINWDDTTSEQVDPTKLAVSLIDASSEQTIDGLSIEYDSSATAWRIKWSAHEVDPTGITFKIRATYTNEFTTSIDSTFTIKITFVE